jgi:predicted acylesterase/phospholipase RssA
MADAAPTAAALKSPAPTAGASTKPVSGLLETDFATPSGRCDMVMKGGITSGIVYPAAILRIAQRFRLSSIGGTSAGAIAAAVAAAAEFRRQTDGATPGAGYMLVKTDIMDWLAEGTNLQSLFVPVALAAPFYWLFLWIISARSALRRRSLRGVINLVITFAVLLFAIYGLVAVFFGGPNWRLFATAKYSALVVIAVIVLSLVTMLWFLPRSNFGTCTGGRARTFQALLRRRSNPLTFWLAARIDAVANTGVDRPLTFGDLWAGRVRPAGDNGPADPEARVIDLQMVTTCLTLGRPFTLPFASRIFYFRPDELTDFFPKYVVDWMAAHARKPDPNDKQQVARHKSLEAQGYLPLPSAADFPVVVATRMSLSFPILLSAVRLWTIDRTRAVNKANPAAPVIEPAWFSDGGLSSNFPIGMFDAPLPSRPTLGITLEEFPPDADQADPDEGAVIPENNLPNTGSSWTRFSPNVRPSNLPGFIGAIINAMQNWQDTMQSEAPGYRDRIAHVRLSSSEGGLNLTMPPEVITRLIARGERAGALLVDHFAEPPAAGVETTWKNHRRVRLRTTIDVAETYAARFRRVWALPTTATWTSYPDLLAGMVKGEKGYPYDSLARQAEALRVAQHVAGVAGIVTPNNSVHVGAPRPTSELRGRPRF